MKFTDGYWSLAPGVEAYYAAEAYEVEAGGASLKVVAPTRQVAQRGDTINATVLTVEFASPMADVIRVRLTHFSGGRPKLPQFELLRHDMSNVLLSNDEAAATLTSGRLSVRVSRSRNWQVEFLTDGRLITGSGPQGMGLIKLADGSQYVHDQLSLGVGECVYGLGERFTAFVKNGQAVDIWNEDGGTSSEQAYKNIPFYLTNRGYGVFVNHPGRVSFEVASEKVESSAVQRPRPVPGVFPYLRPTPKEVLEKYTALTGRPALPPRLVVRPVADHLVHHHLRRGHGHRVSSRAWPTAICRCMCSISTAFG